MAALDFPTTPTVGQKYPSPAVAGAPVYTWDGEKWTTVTAAFGAKVAICSDGSVPMAAQLTLVSPPVAATDAAAKGYVDSKVTAIAGSSKSAAYTTVLADANTVILHPAADTTARTFTIDSNANVPYPVNTAITFINQHGAGVLTIAVTADAMYLAGAGTTGNRTLAANGLATAIKVTSTEWLISGTGLS